MFNTRALPPILSGAAVSPISTLLYTTLTLLKSPRFGLLTNGQRIAYHLSILAMTVLFKKLRIAYFSTFLILSAIVLAISAYFANIYLPNDKAHAGFSIYAVVISTLTIIFGLIQLFTHAQPRTETPFLFIVGIFWLSVAAWALDQSAEQECFDLGNAQTQTQHGPVSSRTICYTTKIVEAFSWTIFVMFAIAFIIVINRSAKARTLGHPDIWAEPIDNLPWYDELPGYPGATWFGSDYHRYHHRYGYEKSPPMVGPAGASRRGYRQLSPPTEPVMTETSPSEVGDHYTRARGKSSHRRAASVNSYDDSRSVAPSMAPGMAPSMAPSMAPRTRQRGASMGHGQAQSAVPMAGTSHRSAGVGYGQAPSTMPMAPMQPGGATVSVGGQSIQQLPGHSLVIKPSATGGAPHIEQVPGFYQDP